MTGPALSLNGLVSPQWSCLLDSHLPCSTPCGPHTVPRLSLPPYSQNHKESSLIWSSPFPTKNPVMLWQKANALATHIALGDLDTASWLNPTLLDSGPWAKILTLSSHWILKSSTHSRGSITQPVHRTSQYHTVSYVLQGKPNKYMFELIGVFLVSISKLNLLLL